MEANAPIYWILLDDSPPAKYLELIVSAFALRPEFGSVILHLLQLDHARARSLRIQHVHFSH